ncbi:hypothetical protein KIH74_06285 [Kineosporia sp. J2-2]|uniref:Uncharacterized protein n=1 Tax=Kineosporia corallincola TaxID=2835133 RepID=A0ABS5TBS6_9ACTN|nr:hypothetical protein [Kineosporia corallincola]MBT0768525.1 hypothetical protein [Kineosporia corallincola]
MWRIITVAAAATASAVGTLALSSPAQAATQERPIGSGGALTATAGALDFEFEAAPWGSCEDIPLAFTISGPAGGSYILNTTFSSGLVGDVDFEDFGSTGTATVTQEAFWCPTDGFGVFGGTASLTLYDAEYNKTLEQDYPLTVTVSPLAKLTQTVVTSVARTAKVGRSVSVRTCVSGDGHTLAYQSVRVVFRKPGASSETKAPLTYTDSLGCATTSVKVSNKGTYAFRSLSAATDQFEAGASSVRKVSVSR